MAITIDPLTYVINVPKADLTLIQSSPTEIRELNLNAFRLDLKDLEDDQQGMVMVKTHSHNTEVLLGGITYARSIEILEPYTTTFEDGQYAVNLVGANSNVGDRINVNQVSVRSQNSAGLISSQAIEYSSFNGGVTIDVNSTTSGTVFPAGTPQAPVNNLADAELIATIRGFEKLFFLSDWTFPNTTSMADYEFHGQGLQKTVLTFESGSVLANVEIFDATITGLETGIVGFTDCKIIDLGSVGLAPSSVDVLIQRCFIEGLITIPSNYTGTLTAVDSWAIPDLNGDCPVLDMGDAAMGLQMNNLSGFVCITNSTVSSNEIEIFLNSGGIELASSVTAGNFTLTGTGSLLNMATGIRLDSKGLVSGSVIENTHNAVESLRAHHTGFGKTIYWDPLLGDDSYDGTSESLSVATFAAAHALATDGGHDVIIALSSSTGQTLVDETLTFTKNYLFLRGPGRDFKILPTSTIAPTITIDAIGVEVSGIVAETAATGGQDVIRVNDGADFFFLDHVWSHFSSGSIVHVEAPTSLVYGRIHGCFFSHAGDYGIHLNGNIRHTKITQTEIDGATVDGIKLEGTTIRNNVIERTVAIYASGGYGINLISPANRNIIHSGAALYDNALGDVFDGGTNTEYEQEIKLAATVDAVWDEELTGMTHNIQNSSGKRLRDLSSQAIHTDTARGSAINGNQIEFALAASDVDGAYDPAMITIIDGTGQGQTRLILEYDGTNRIATVDRDWKVFPDNTSEYIIFADAGREHVNEGLARGGTIDSITLNALASSTDDAYTHQTIFLRSGKGEDQVKHVTGYNGTTKVAMIHSDWFTIPDTTTGYVMLPILHHELLQSELDAVGESVWGALEADHTITGSFGAAITAIRKKAQAIMNFILGL